jgi:hypothetical protein
VGPTVTLPLAMVRPAEFREADADASDLNRGPTDHESWGGIVFWCLRSLGWRQTDR